MAGAGGSSSRLLRATSKAFKKHDSSSNHKSSSSSTMTTSSGGGNFSSSPYRIPSLKFPFPWEANKSSTHSRTSRRRAAEQRAALIALGVGGAASSSSITPEKKKLGGVISLPDEEASSVDLVLPLAYEITRRLVLRQLGAAWLALNSTCWSKIAETVIHRAVVGCRSFTLIGVAGSLLGSVPCFVKGCVLVVKSFLVRFQATSDAADHGEIMKLLIDALDMFLIGTALLTFAMGLFTMFYGGYQKPGQHIDSSHLGTFNLKKLKEGASIRSITHAKTRIGHAIVLLLQAGVLEEFKSVPLSSGLDTACFAGALLASSAAVFLLSKLTGPDPQQRSSKETLA